MPALFFDYRFGHLFGLCQYAPDGDDGDGGDDADDKAPKGGGDGKAPPWASEFGEKFDPDKAWSLITTLRDAERKLKGTTRTLEGKVKEHEDAGKSATEKLQGEVEELKGKLSTFEQRERQAGLRVQIAEEGRRAGALYPDDIARLIEESDLDIGDDGKIKNVATLVKGLKTSRPALFNRTGVDASAGRGGATPEGQDMNALIRRSAGRQ